MSKNSSQHKIDPSSEKKKQKVENEIKTSLGQIFVYSVTSGEETLGPEKKKIPVGWSSIAIEDIFNSEELDRIKGIENLENLGKWGNWGDWHKLPGHNWSRIIERDEDESDPSMKVYGAMSESGDRVFMVEFLDFSVSTDIYCPNWPSLFELLNKIIPVVQYFCPATVTIKKKEKKREFPIHC